MPFGPRGGAPPGGADAATLEREADGLAERLTGTGELGDSPPHVTAAPSGGAGPVPAVVREALQSPGHPLSGRISRGLEAMFGRELGPVRIHDHARADAAAASLGALAFTYGNDIGFRAGRYAPETQAGSKLLVHELAHVIQQCGSPRLQLQEDPKAGIGTPLLFSVSISRELDEAELLLAFSQQFSAAKAITDGRAWRWSRKPSKVTKADVAKGYVLVTVVDDAIAPATASEKKERSHYFGGLPAADKTAINAEADLEFWQKTNYKKGQKLGGSADDKRMAESWTAIRDELLRNRQAIDALPDGVRALLFGEQAAALTPADFARVLRLASKLTELSPAELAEYRSRATSLAANWDQLEVSVDRFRAERQTRSEREAERLGMETRLFGLDTIYRRYRAYLQSLKTSAGLGRMPMPGAAGTALGMIPSQNKERAALIADLAAAGFPGGLDAFQKFLDGYTDLFEREAHTVATIMLDQYEHTLREAAKKRSAGAPDATLRLAEIAAQKEAIERTRKALWAKPGIVYELPDLINATLTSMRTAPGSVYDQIVRDHVGDVHFEQFVTQLMLGVIAIAAGLFTAGGGTAAILATGTAFGIGAYGAYQEFEKFQMQSDAHVAGLALESPSVAWLVVSVVGVAFDAAALSAVLKASPGLRGALGAFNAGAEADDAAKFAAKVEKLSEVEAGIRSKIIEAAKGEAKSRAAWKALGQPAKVLLSSLLPGGAEFGRFTYAVYLSLRNGLRRIDLFLKTREAIELVGDIAKLGPEEMVKLKSAYLQAVKEIESIAAHGKKLGVADDELRRFMELPAIRPGMTVDAVKTEMEAWKTVSALEAANAGAHFSSRHGAQTTLAQQLLRATTGLTPDGVQLAAGPASRFLSHSDEALALTKADEIFRQTKQSSFSFEMPSIIGEGYKKGGGAVVQTRKVTAVYKQGKLFTMFPNILGN